MQKRKKSVVAYLSYIFVFVFFFFLFSSRALLGESHCRVRSIDLRNRSAHEAVEEAYPLRIRSWTMLCRGIFCLPSHSGRSLPRASSGTLRRFRSTGLAAVRPECCQHSPGKILCLRPFLSLLPSEIFALCFTKRAREQRPTRIATILHGDFACFSKNYQICSLFDCISAIVRCTHAESKHRQLFDISTEDKRPFK